MENQSSELKPEDTKSSKKKGSNWLLWWKIDPEELAKQVSQYNTLKLWHSARGTSVACLLFSVVITIAFILYGLMKSTSFVDVALFLILGLFIYLGQRWAMIAAMILWTIEKGYQLVDTGVPNSHPMPIVAIIWWAIYMHPFYLAFRVENERRKKVEVITT